MALVPTCAVGLSGSAYTDTLVAHEEGACACGRTTGSADDERPAGSTPEAPDDGEKRKRSIATELVDIITKAYRLAVSTEGTPFAVAHDGPLVARPLRASRESLRAELAAEYADSTGRAAPSSALADALLVAEGRALRAEPEPVHLRAAHHGDRLVLDLGRADGHALVIGADGWAVTPSPVVFRRTALTAPLPDPSGPGDLDRLRTLTRTSKESWPLLVAWLIVNFDPDIAKAILAFLGQHGSGKSTTARMVAAVMDPSTAPLRSPPRDLTSWAVAASGSYVVPIDNISTISAWLSDAMCRASTGEGFVNRKLYTDDDVSVLAFRRSVILTSIDPGATRGDLGDRLIAIETLPIDGGSRRTDDQLAADWAAAWPHVLAGLADLTVKVLQILPTIAPPSLPRMADFYRTLCAVDKVLETKGAKHYMGSRDRVALDVLDADQVGLAVKAFLKKQKEWEGTVAALLAELDQARGEKRPPKDWPATPKALGGALRRIAPALAVAKIVVTFGTHERDGHHLALTNENPVETDDEEERKGDKAPGIRERGDGHDGHRDHRDRHIPTESLAPSDDPEDLGAWCSDDDLDELHPEGVS